MKTIGILTSGGDSQGMNAAIRAVTRTAIDSGFKVMGIRKGYLGLITGDIVELTATSVSDIINRGGTMLHTARCLEFKEEAGVVKAVETCKKFGIDGIVVIGGDGSFRGARDLTLHGIPCVAIPGTIDNDIVCSEDTIGFDTALNVCIDLVDYLRDTSASHNRCSVVQIMGRNAGWVTLEASLATGATVTLVPEVEFDFQTDVIDKIKKGQELGKEYFIVMVSEGIFANVKSNKNYEYLTGLGLTNAAEFAKRIEEETGIVSRESVFGHVQRGGSPTAHDRILATTMGTYAVRLLEQGISNRVVVVRSGNIVDLDILEALSMEKPFDEDRLKMANMLNI